MTGTPKDPGSWNKYSYTKGDPVNGYDPPGTLTYCVDGPNGDGQTCHWQPDDGSLPDPSTISDFCSGWMSMGVSMDPAMYSQLCGSAGAVPPLTGGTSVGGQSTYSILLAIDDSRQRVEGLLANPQCAAQIGADGPASAQSRASSISISAVATYAGTQSLGVMTLQPDGSFTPGQAMAAYNPNTQSISLNPTINWSAGTVFACLADGTGCKTIDLVAGEAARVGAASMTVQQWMDLTILHEISHFFGQDHPGTNDVNDTAGFNIGIWGACFGPIL